MGDGVSYRDCQLAKKRTLQRMRSKKAEKLFIPPEISEIENDIYLSDHVIVLNHAVRYMRLHPDDNGYWVGMPPSEWSALFKNLGLTISPDLYALYTSTEYELLKVQHEVRNVFWENHRQEQKNNANHNGAR